MRVSNYIEYIQRCENELAKAFNVAAKHHILEPDVHEMCQLLASWSLDHVENLGLMIDRYGKEEEKEPDRLDYSILTIRTGSLGLLRDLHDLWLMANEVKLCWIILLQAAKALRDEQLKLSCLQYGKQTKRQTEWLMTKIKQSSSQILTVPVDAD
jgi:hypothetical protein